METYLVPMWVVECGVQRDGCISMVKAADAQATVEALQAQLEAAERHNTILQDANKVALEKVEALQAEKLMLERGVSAQSALIDGLQSQLIQRTAALEAVQHERDEANSHVKFLGATKQANGSFCLDMKKYHARYRCGRHRDDPWKGIDTEIDCFVCLKHDLDAEREKVKGLEQCVTDANLAFAKGVQAGGLNNGFQGCAIAFAEWFKCLNEIIELKQQLSQLQALVRAYSETKVAFDAGRLREDRHAWQERYRALVDAEQALIATLDATTPAAKGGDGE